MELDRKSFHVKWNKQTFNISTSKQTIEELKVELKDLTNILVNRQKLLFKGKVLADSESINVIPDASTLTLLGNAESDVVVTTNDKKIIFMEDLSNEERAKFLKEKGEDICFGLQNLGNTCYFNALIQCYGRIDELKKALIDISQMNYQTSNLQQMFCAEFGKVYAALDKAYDTVVPTKLVQMLRALNPSFAANNNGNYIQQDADECLSMMLNIFKSELKNNSEGEKYSKNLIDELFGVALNITLTNVEDPSDIKSNSDTAYKLICYIDNNTSELVAGLKNSLVENVELYSEAYNRNSFFAKKQLITRLPPYLNIQFMRFFWKKAVEGMPDSKDGKAKILKSVMFSKIIDIYDLCAPDVQEVLKLGREIENKMLKEDLKYRADLSCMKQSDNMIPTGRYQLIAVCTHQGKSSEHGHYIGWTNRKDDKWAKFDDHLVTPCKITEILELKGGGDWHMSYICFYKSLDVPFQEIK